MRFNGTIHDFMRLNALRDSESTRAAIKSRGRCTTASFRHRLRTRREYQKMAYFAGRAIRDD